MYVKQVVCLCTNVGTESRCFSKRGSNLDVVEVVNEWERLKTK